MRIIEVVPYDASWKEEFENERELILSSIDSLDLTINHIGSTSVEGLAAKPIIDMLIEVGSIDEIDAVEEQFVALDYEAKGEFGIPGRRYFRKGGDNRTHQIHAFEKGSDDAIRHLAFKHYLIEHESVRLEYEGLKYAAARDCENDMGKYCELKNDFIQYHEKLAVAWYEND